MAHSVQIHLILPNDPDANGRWTAKAPQGGSGLWSPGMVTSVIRYREPEAVPPVPLGKIYIHDVPDDVPLERIRDVLTHFKDPVLNREMQRDVILHPTKLSLAVLQTFNRDRQITMSWALFRGFLERFDGTAYTDDQPFRGVAVRP
jgi:hypothetical protein